MKHHLEAIKMIGHRFGDGDKARIRELYEDAMKILKGGKIDPSSARAQEISVRSYETEISGVTHLQILVAHVESGFYVRLLHPRTGKPDKPSLEIGKLLLLESRTQGQSAVLAW